MRKSLAFRRIYLEEGNLSTDRKEKDSKTVGYYNEDHELIPYLVADVDDHVCLFAITDEEADKIEKIKKIKTIKNDTSIN